MELEELKRSWDLLSARLDREEVIRRQELKSLLKTRLCSYLRYVQAMVLFGLAVVPFVVAVGKLRGVSASVIWTVLIVYLVAFAPSFRALRLLTKAARWEGDLVEQEQCMTHYAVFLRGYCLFQIVVATLLVAGIIFWAADYYTQHGIWWTVGVASTLSIVVCAIAVRWEWDRISDLRQRLRNLREFEQV